MKLRHQQTIALLTGVSLAMNPRALKEASALSLAGYAVQVLGTDCSSVQLITDQELARHFGFKFISVASVGRETLKRQLKSLFFRARTTITSRIQKRFQCECSFRLGHFIPELLFYAKSLKSDYYIVHLEQAMHVGSSLINNGYNVGVDIEDWYSEDLMPASRKHRPLKLLKHLEQKILSNCLHASATSVAMSEALSSEYGCNLPTVIYNAFPWSDRHNLDGELKDRRDRKVPSLHWYSQTLGYGRGLEQLCAALPYVKHPMEIHLRGQPTGDFQQWLQDRLPENWRSRVFIHGLVPNGELLSRISEHDIGFAGEQKYCRNRDLTVTNKILHYMLGGLAIVASDTSGQREIAALAPGSVRLYSTEEPESLALQLNILLGSSVELQLAKAASLQAAQKTFCWEMQSPPLIRGVQYALDLAKSRAAIKKTKI